VKNRIEGESGRLAVRQLLLVDVLGLESSESKPDETHEEFLVGELVDAVLVCPGFVPRKMEFGRDGVTRAPRVLSRQCLP